MPTSDASSAAVHKNWRPNSEHPHKNMPPRLATLAEQSSEVDEKAELHDVEEQRQRGTQCEGSRVPWGVAAEHYLVQSTLERFAREHPKCLGG